MIKYFFLIFILTAAALWGQNSFKAVLKDKESKLPLVGASAVVDSTAIGASSNEAGLLEITAIPNGEQTISFSYIGYKTVKKSFLFPLREDKVYNILLEHEEEETEAVIISATRSSRTIADNPTRVEAISGEELAEKGNMKPGDIRMLLNESTGIQTQQTSATSYNSSIRIQGLDGKYTQIQKDGFPLYSGFSGGLSLLQIIPLDLKQVEVIKGASSTLYGGGAIAGLINLVSKTPAEERELSVLLNGTSALGLDASAFYSQKFEKVGTTVFVSYNAGTPYDPADIGLTAIPEFSRYTINPKLFFYLNENATFYAGFNSTIEDRTGGDIKYIEGKADSVHSYFEENNTTRFSTQAGFDYQISEEAKVSIKNSISFYDRRIKIPDFEFTGEQLSSFSEAVYSHTDARLEWITGLNLWTDQFKQKRIDSSPKIDYTHVTFGAFVQNTWNASQKISLETGLRFDYQDIYGSFVLPRMALLYKVSPKLTFRLGGGMGYKIPTVFTEDAERLHFKNVLPIDENSTEAEESIGTNFDVNYRTSLTDEISLSTNTLFFYTHVNNPIELTNISDGNFIFQQPSGFIDTRGVEANIKLTYNHYKLFVGYTHADVKWHKNDRTISYPLVARHRLNNVLIYEIHNQLRIGLEAYYFSPQKLSDERTGKEYWILGLMTEKMWDSYSLFLNFENFLDTRQTRFEQIYKGSITKPVFNDIYAPLDGFVINGGIKIRF